MALLKCNRKIWKRGKVVFITHSIEPQKIEAWVKEIAQKSGQRVDWHYFGGKAVVKALGNIDKVEEVLEELKPEHDKLFKEALAIT